MAETPRGSPGYLGKLRSNFLGTEFVLFDDGAKAHQADMRCELGAVLYEPNLLGTKGPRRMTALVPKLGPGGEAPLALTPCGEGNTLLGRCAVARTQGGGCLPSGPSSAWEEAQPTHFTLPPPPLPHP